MADTRRILNEHAYPDRLRLRVVLLEELFLAVAGAQLGGLDTGRDAVWRWLAFERLKPPFQEQLYEVRRDVSSDYGRLFVRRLVAGWGVEWRHMALELAVWQVQKVERMPRWLMGRLAAEDGPYGEDRLDRLRRAIFLENVTEVQAALAACQTYTDRALEPPAVTR